MMMNLMTVFRLFKLYNTSFQSVSWSLKETGKRRDTPSGCMFGSCIKISTVLTNVQVKKIYSIIISYDYKLLL